MNKNIKLTSLVMLLLLAFAPTTLAQDLEFTSNTQAGDDQTFLGGAFDWWQFGKEVTDVDGDPDDSSQPGTGGGYTLQGINITPNNSSIIIQPGSTATNTIRIYNQELSTQPVRLSTRTLSPDLQGRILFDGQEAPRTYVLGSRDSSNGFVDVTITYLTDFTAGEENPRTYTAEIQAEGIRTGSDLHTAQIRVDPEGRSVLTGFATAPLGTFGEREDVCVTNAQGEEVCRRPILNAISGVTVPVWGGLLLFIVAGTLFIVWWRRRPKQETPVVLYGDEGFYTAQKKSDGSIDRRPYSPTGDEEFRFTTAEEADDLELTDGGGVRWK